MALFKRLPRGLMLTHEGESLLPVLCDSFDRIAGLLERFEGGHYRDVLTVGAVGTFTVGWLLPRLEDFQARHPFIDLRLSTHNNRVDIAAEGLDYAIRFGGGAWHGTEALALFEAPLTVLCCPEVAAQLHSPADLLQHTLLRSYRADEWPLWFQAAGLPAHAPLTQASSSTPRWPCSRRPARVSAWPWRRRRCLPGNWPARASGVRSPPK